MKKIKVACPMTTARILKGAGRTISEAQRFDPDCWEWRGAISSSGYPNVRVTALLAEELLRAFGGPVPEWLQGHQIAATVLHPGHRPWGGLVSREVACHTCDNRRCVNPHHIRVGSHLDNKIDSIAKANGGRHSLLDLTQEDVDAIARAVERETRKAVAARYDLNPRIVSKFLTPGGWSVNQVSSWVGRGPFDRFNGSILLVTE